MPEAKLRERAMEIVGDTLDEREKRARSYCGSVSDEALRVKISVDNENSAHRLAELGVTEPQDYPDPDKLTRQEMIDMIAPD
jgi:hypothetical protein